MQKLAIDGGEKARIKPIPFHKTTDMEEVNAVVKVLKKGLLSQYEGSNTQYFMGGPEVKKFELQWQEYFEIPHAIAVNSATSGLYAAIGALGVGPGDEVIVPPWTMTASVAAVLCYNAIPVFADIEEDTFNIDPVSIRKRITKRTKAIMVVHLFGHPANMDEILSIAEEFNLYIIEDAAQSPGAYYNGRLTGTIGDIGIYSLNCNKIIQCGEGGVAVTRDNELATRLRLIRNHAESVVGTGMKVESLVNMLGWNYRMNEIEAAIASIQLNKLSDFLKERVELAQYAIERLSSLVGITIPPVKKSCNHVYYRLPIKLNRQVIPIDSTGITKLLATEGIEFDPGMVPLYKMPIYQERIVFGNKGCPFSCSYYTGEVDYSTGICPVAEKFCEEIISTETIRPSMGKVYVDEIYEAFSKIIHNKDRLPYLVSQL